MSYWTRPLLAVLVILAVPARARADAKTEAEQHIARATELHKDGKFAEALDELTVAYTLDPRPELLYAIGQVHVKLGNCEQAITFYQRFLSTKPERGAADAAKEAIRTCKTAPPEADGTGPTGPTETDRTPHPPPPPPRIERRTRPWYTDVVGDALVGGGVVLGVVGGVMFSSARSDLDAADAAPTYDRSAELVDSAHRKRNYAVALGAGGVALIGAGIVSYLVRDRSTETAVSVVPTTTGGYVTWAGRF